MIWFVELLLPVALLCWLAFKPARHLRIRLLQIVGTAAILLALQLAGLWILPPWWTPWVYWALFAVALWRGRSAPTRSATGAANYAQIIFWAGAIGIGGWISSQALSAGIAPAGEIAAFSMPFQEGRYYVANGGSQDILNTHLRTLPRATTGQRNYWGQSYGVDITAMNRWGLPTNTTKTILAPCAGRVVRAHDGDADGGLVDLSSPTARAGNYALIRCGKFDILLAHMRNGSLRVRTGDLVTSGQSIGALGNSGASDLPHLHIHAQRPGTGTAPFSGKPVPMHLDGRYLVRGDRL
jgi:murein DD-endopeptidase MepM/ murein hydrolase activator NlpD